MLWGKPRDEHLFEAGSLRLDLKGRSVRGGAVTLAAQGSKPTIQTTSLVVLARLLRPANYGLIGMVTVVIRFAALFNDLGPSTVTMQRAQINHQQISTLFGVNVAAGILIALIVAALASPPGTGGSIPIADPDPGPPQKKKNEKIARIL
jgi:O-antigen/teichoic acid export membrane protein